jgi:HK97 family phage prohead protease
MLTKGFDIGFKDADTSKGVVTGYFAVFGNKDLDGDIIERGAFSKTIQERGPMGKQLIKYLLDHDKTKVVAKLQVLQEDEKGLYYEGKIGGHAAGQDFLKMVESELINQHSFGYYVPKDKSFYDSNRKANIIKEVFMYEGSAIQFLGANPETNMIGLKSFDAYFERLEKFIRTTDCTDETIQQLELKLKSLTALLKPEQTTSKDQEADRIKELLKTFGNHGY